MEKEQIIILGLIFFVFFHLTEAEICNDSTFIYGKVYFDNYVNSQVINATIEVWNNNPDIPGNTLLLSTNTNATGYYSIDISKNMTSTNQTFYVKAKWYDKTKSQYITWDYKTINISCGNQTKQDFKVEKSCSVQYSPKTISGQIKKKNGTEWIDAPEENITVILNFHPKGSRDFSITAKANVNASGNLTVYHLCISDYMFHLKNYNWPIDMLVSIEPFNGHYYRYYNSGNFTKYLNASVTCESSSINNAHFYAFDRKNASQNCTYNDECLSNNCYNKKCASCIRGDANNDTLIDIFDVVKILEHLAYGINIKNECADMNEDIFVNILDVFAIIQDL